MATVPLHFSGSENSDSIKASPRWATLPSMTYAHRKYNTTSETGTVGSSGLCLPGFRKSHGTQLQGSRGRKKKIPLRQTLTNLSQTRWEKTANGSLIHRLVSEGTSVASHQSSTSLTPPDAVRNKCSRLQPILAGEPAKPNHTWAVQAEGSKKNLSASWRSG